MKRTIGGVIIAPYLPFEGNGKLKESVLHDHIDAIIDAGPDVLYCLGEVEEFAALTLEKRKEIAEAIVGIVANRVPVVINIGTTILEETIELAQHCEQIKADAVYSVPPYYYVLDDSAHVEYFSAVEASISIPLHLYNTPESTKVNFKPSLLVELGRIPGITAMKDSSGDLIQMQEYIETSGLDIFIGGDPLHLPGLVLGAAGTVSGAVGAIFPHLPVKLYDAFKNQNIIGAMEIQRTMTTIYRHVLNTHPNWVQMVKEAIRLVWGFEMGKDIIGFSALAKEDITSLEKAFRNLKLI